MDCRPKSCLSASTIHISSCEAPARSHGRICGSWPRRQKLCLLLSVGSRPADPRFRKGDQLHSYGKAAGVSPSLLFCSLRRVSVARSPKHQQRHRIQFETCCHSLPFTTPLSTHATSLSLAIRPLASRRPRYRPLEFKAIGFSAELSCHSRYNATSCAISETCCCFCVVQRGEPRLTACPEPGLRISRRSAFPVTSSVHD
jgi:hypothetical protein